jgi:hypothetical protein
MVKFSYRTLICQEWCHTNVPTADETLLMKPYLDNR